MNKVIFTADDFGVIPSVNAGITHLVDRGLINSVEVFTNYEKSIENTHQLLKDVGDKPFELGVHLTITSGKPLTNNPGLNPIVENGSFKPFSKINSRAKTNALYNELKLQIEQLMDDDELSKRLTHLTCHHDALWFFPNYTLQLEKLSKKYNLPVRNPKSFPPKRDKMYYTVIVPLLKKLNLSDEDVKLLKATYKLRKKGFFPKVDLNYRAPHYMDSRIYGPIPNLAIAPDRKAKKVLQKQKKLAKMLRKAVVAGGKREDYLIEFMFHLRKGKLTGGHKAFRKEIEGIDYAGINTDYFDSRTIEYETLRFYENKIKALIGDKFELGSWKDAKNMKLLKK